MKEPGQAPVTANLRADHWITLLILNFTAAGATGETALMSILVEPIRTEFGLSDSAVTLLISVIYVVFLIGASPLMGTLADKTNRRTMMAASIALSGIGFALPAVGASVLLLLASRMCVGVANAAFTPPRVSLMGDKFTIEQRPMAMSLIGLGSSIGAWLAISGGGAMAAEHGWRTAVLVFGLSLVGIAVLVQVFVREPQRGAMDDPRASAAGAGKVKFIDALRVAISQRAAFHTMMGGMLCALWAYGLAWWIPAFMGRSLGVPLGQAAAMLGPVHGIVGMGSVLASAVLMIYLGKGDVRKPLWFIFGFVALSTLPSIAMCYMQTADNVVLMTWLFLPASYVVLGPVIATVASCVPPFIRGRVGAIYGTMTSVTSIAIAPMLVGVISDLIAPHLADAKESLRYALVPIALTGFWSAAHFWFACRYVREDIARVETGQVRVGAAAPPAA